MAVVPSESLPRTPFSAIQTAQKRRVPIVPDIMEFVISDRYLNRKNLYPRQATLLKIMFLQEEIFTSYDYDVIGEWENSFLAHGNNGVVPGLLERIRIAKDQGRNWFRQTEAVLGRRGGKGYIGGLGGAYVLWNYLCKLNPQEFYGIDRDKRMTFLVFGGKKEQAKAEQWRDLVNVINSDQDTCFTEFISESLSERLTVYSPHDLDRLEERERKGMRSEMDLATFIIIPKESTLLSGRGPASFAQVYDEMAHVTKSNGGVSAEDVYEAATPSLDQFKNDAWIYVPSSPWQMTGKFYDIYKQAQELDEERKPVYPETFMIQLASWDIYKDWEIAHKLPLVTRKKSITFYPMKQAMQEYDHQMQQLERANPETFKVERRCLDPETRVLCEDLTWKPIGSIVAGDRLVAFDEEAPEAKKERKLRTAEVIATCRTQDEPYRIGFDDGTSVVCSAHHRWFSASAGSPFHYRWRPLYAREDDVGPREIMKVGDRIRYIVEPWEEDHSWEAGYLAGVYDGEGTVWGRERAEWLISFPQNPGVVLDTTLQYLKALGFEPKYMPDDRRCEKYKITGLSSCLRFLGQIGPYRLRNTAIPGFWEGRALGHEDGRAMFKTIVSIDKLPYQELVDIETTTGTFIAEGLISHNSYFATVMDAYLNPDRVDDMFQPFRGDTLVMKTQGRLDQFYVMHGDPSKSGANFGLAIAHVVPARAEDEYKMDHVIFDFIHHWNPADFVENDFEIDYQSVEEEIQEYIKAFMPSEVSFDQFGAALTSRLKRWARETRFAKAVQVFERTATQKENYLVAEIFKTALGMGLIHAPYYELAEKELKFLQEKTPGKVDKPDEGPVQTKDVADCIMICTKALIGPQVAAFMGNALSTPLHATQQGGTDPFPSMRPPQDTGDPIHQQLARSNSRRNNAPIRPGPRGRSFANR